MTYISNDFVAHGTHNGTFTSTYCSTEPSTSVIKVSSDHGVAKVEADVSAFGSFEGMGTITINTYLDDVFTPIVSLGNVWDAHTY